MQPLKQIITPDAPYSFFDYFKLDATTDEVVNYFGYSFALKPLVLPRAAQTGAAVSSLQEHLAENMHLVGLTNELARREFLIAPVLAEAARLTQAKIRVEYAIDAGPQLRGNLDYFLLARHNLLIVEAKNADLAKGFTQLATELIALAQLLQEDSPNVLYGAVSVGTLWQFGTLNRNSREIAQDLDALRVPKDLAELLQVLVGILA